MRSRFWQKWVVAPNRRWWWWLFPRPPEAPEPEPPEPEPDPPPVEPPPEDGQDEIDIQTVAAHNEFRGLEHGSGPLLWVRWIDDLANDHAREMARRDRLYHGNTFPAGENVAQTWAFDVDEVMGLWMGSSGHRRNILEGSFREIGVGVARAASGRVYWCVMFGR